MADIFLSYAREDVIRAQLFAEALAVSGGWSIFWDRQIAHGHDFVEQIQQQLDQARCIVVLWSEHSVKSPFVRDEAAEGHGGRLVPVIIDRVRPPLGFRQLQTAELSGWAGDTSQVEFGRLVDSIRARVVSKGSTPAPPAADVYVSYSHLDDLKTDGQRQGWVGNFQRAVSIRLAQRIGREFQVWRDGGREVGVLDFETNLAVIRQSKVFVAIVSPWSVSSEWAHRELSEFLKTPPLPAAHGSERVFKVVKTPVLPESQPAEIRHLLGYEFFKIDQESGVARELGDFGSDSQREYWITLDDLCRDMAEIFKSL